MQNKIQQLVGQVFFGTVLKEMRSEMDSSNPMNGGKAGQTYMGQLDQYLIDKIAGSSNFKVGQKIAESWMGTQNTSSSTSSTTANAKTVETLYKQTTSKDGLIWQAN
jgi:hypothetical protein